MLHGNMTGSVDAIPLSNLSLSLLPALVVLVILQRWSAGAGAALYGVGRMIAQLALVGYVLTFIFGTAHPAVVLGTLSVMLTEAGWIALRPVARRRKAIYRQALAAISVAGLSTLAPTCRDATNIVTQGVLAADPWHDPTVLIPLGGMVFASSMNAVSLSAERLDAELSRGASYLAARPIAMRSALIPQVNTLFAVGLVSLPGMMTGQILSGISPLIAVRYQIMVMCMLFGAAGMSAACFLAMQRPRGDESSPSGAA